MLLPKISVIHPGQLWTTNIKDLPVNIFKILHIDHYTMNTEYKVEDIIDYEGGVGTNHYLNYFLRLLTILSEYVPPYRKLLLPRTILSH